MIKLLKALSYLVFFCPSSSVRLKLHMFSFHVSTLVGKHLVNNCLYYPSARLSPLLEQVVP